MTNAEKWLVEGADVEKLVREIKEYKKNNRRIGFRQDDEELKNFFKANTMPEITSEERIVLENIAKCFTIIERKDDILYLEGDLDGKELTTTLGGLHLMFKFIKNGERYDIDTLLES